jgi:hypothetical protein
MLFVSLQDFCVVTCLGEHAVIEKRNDSSVPFSKQYSNLEFLKWKCFQANISNFRFIKILCMHYTWTLFYMTTCITLY